MSAPAAVAAATAPLVKLKTAMATAAPVLGLLTAIAMMAPTHGMALPSISTAQSSIVTVATASVMATQLAVAALVRPARS